MNVIFMALIAAGLLFWLAPLVRRLLDRLSGIERNQRVSVLITSLILRGVAVGLMAMLWLGLNEFRQTVPAITKARVDVLLDLSESLVHADAPDLETYLRNAHAKLATWLMLRLAQWRTGTRHVPLSGPPTPQLCPLRPPHLAQ